ncbi:MAG: phosphatidylserine decarboxylase, partial [Verrucomicrobiota bacterium]
MFTAQTLLEGKWAIIILLALTITGLRWCWPVAVIAAVLLVFTISFFRDPEAKIPADEKKIVAPATGKIVEITPVGDKTLVAIFLSVFDVHVQRA